MCVLRAVHPICLLILWRGSVLCAFGAPRPFLASQPFLASEMQITSNGWSPTVAMTGGCPAPVCVVGSWAHSSGGSPCSASGSATGGPGAVVRTQRHEHKAERMCCRVCDALWITLLLHLGCAASSGGRGYMTGSGRFPLMLL